ncbi:MAG: hypothetical protein SF051_05130 [Elusimicrobiota bacterium]|nr:hypothetical protein [Elusimicrobiota bacterium]
MGLERAAMEGPGGGADFASVITALAGKAGLKVVKKTADMVVVPFDMGEGRKQNVFVSFLGLDAAKQNIVSVFSPALKLAQGQEVGAKTANDLLRRTAKLARGAWAIITIGGDDYLGCLETLALETMQPEELKYACFGTSATADDLEKSLGVDSF